MPKLTDLAGTIRNALQIGLRTATVQARSILFRSQFTGTLTWSPTSDVTQQLQDRAGTIALLSDLAAGNPAQVVQTYLTAGNFSTVIPSNCTHFAVQAVGSTGGGGGGRKSAAAIAAFGGGGSASANTTGGWIFYSLAGLGLSPGATLSGTIGAGGTGGAGTSVDSTNGGNGGNGGDTFLRIGAAGTNYLVLVSGGVGASGGTTTAGSGGGAVGGNTLIVGVAGSSSSATASPPAGAASSVGGGSGSAGSGISTANVAFATNGGGRGSGQLGFVTNPPAGVAIGAAGLNGTRLPGTVGTLIPGHGASGGGAALTGAAGKGGDAAFGGGAGGGGAARDGVGNSSGAGGNGAAGGLQIIFYSQSPGQPLDSDLTAIANLAPTSLGLIERTAEGAMATRSIGAGGAAVVAAADAAAARTAVGLGNIQDTANGIAVRTGLANYSSFYQLSVQSSGTSSWIEILNGGGVNKGAFFGMAGSGADGDNFDLFNWQGGAIRFHVATVAQAVQSSMILLNTGHLSVPGGVAARFYTPGTMPVALAVPYGLIVTVYDTTSNPSTYLAYTDNSNWYKLRGVL